MSTVRKVGMAVMVVLTMTLAACTSSTVPARTSSTSSTSTPSTTRASTTATTIAPPQDVDAAHFINSKVGWAVKTTTRVWS
jgi:hypothetical protein